MPLLLDATDAQQAQILSDTYSLWGDGLPAQGYVNWNRAQLMTPWGRAHLRRVVWSDGSGGVLASAKRYALRLRLDGRAVRALGIGAVFTPPALRGRGHARALIEAMCREAADDGFELALLFSEIGPGYYQRLGFRPVPVASCDIVVHTKVGAPAMLVRGGEDSDAPAVAAMHVERMGRYRFGLEPDADLVRYSVTKKRLMAAADPGGRRSVEYFVVEEGHQAVAFVLLQVTRSGRAGEPDGWSLASCGDRDPDGARVGALLQVLLARTPAARLPRIRSWWPAGLTPPQLDVRPRGQAAEVMMIRPLAPSGEPRPPLAREQVFYWHGDAF
jgi:GNAT superfamily N-acetyltransferase